MDIISGVNQIIPRLQNKYFKLIGCRKEEYGFVVITHFFVCINELNNPYKRTHRQTNLFFSNKGDRIRRP